MTLLNAVLLVVILDCPACGAHEIHILTHRKITIELCPPEEKCPPPEKSTSASPTTE